MLDTETVFEFSKGVIEAIGVHIKTKNVVVVLVYRQPDDPKQKLRSGSKEFNNFLNSLNRTLKDLPAPSPDILVCGDFNLPHADWENKKCPGATSEEKKMFEDLLNITDEHLLLQMISKPTHRGGNTLDLIFKNNFNYIHSSSSNVTVLSDHYIVECKVYYKGESESDNNRTNAACEDEASFYDLNFFSENVNWESLNYALSAINWRLYFRKCDPDDMVGTFLLVCLDISKRHIPLKRQSKCSTKNHLTSRGIATR